MSWTDFYNDFIANVTAGQRSGTGFVVNTVVPFAPFFSAVYDSAIGTTKTVTQYSGSGSNTNVVSEPPVKNQGGFGDWLKALGEGLGAGSTGTLLLAGLVAYAYLKK